MAMTKKRIPKSDFHNPLYDTDAQETELARTYQLEARKITMKVLASPSTKHMHPADIYNKIADQLDSKANTYNAIAGGGKDNKWPMVGAKGLPFDSLARFVAFVYNMCHIQTADTSRNLPIYAYMTTDICHNVNLLGTYCDDPTIIKRCIHEWAPGMPDNQVSTVMSIISEIIPIRHKCENDKLVPCRNVIVDLGTRTYFAYTPEYVFTSKILTDYNPNIEMPRIEQADGTVWTPDQLIPSFTYDPEKAVLLYKIAAACLRPNKVWEVSPWFYSTRGNNGKGTLCSLIRNIIGRESVANLSLPQLNNDFYMAQAVNKLAVIADENPVGIYLEDTTNYKNMVTGDPININQKYEKVYSYHWTGMVIQCINDLPKVRDRTSSFARRLLIIEFDQCFTGRANPAIKNDYLKREDVLQWFLKVLLELEFDEIEIPESSRALTLAYQEANDPMVEFVNEIKPKLVWDLYPNTFAFALYKEWMAKNHPASKPLGRNNFISEWTRLMTEDHEWIYPAKKTYYTSKGRMDDPELLINDYNLEDWADKSKSRYRDLEGWCTLPDKLTQYRGVLRRVPRHAIDPNRADYAERMAEHVDLSLAPCSSEDVAKILSLNEDEVTERQD